MAAVFFFPFLGKAPLLDWDEAFYAQMSREMVESGDYLLPKINGKIFYYIIKPPGFLWAQAAAMKIFGVHELAARIPNAVCGMIVLLMLFELGRKIKDAKFGALWASVYGCSLLPFSLFKMGLMDPWYHFTAFLGAFLFFWAWVILFFQKLLILKLTGKFLFSWADLFLHRTLFLLRGKIKVKLFPA